MELERGRRTGLGSPADISVVVFDPLDGSSNIDAGVNVGTIFGVYKVVSRTACIYLYYHSS